MKVVSSLKSLKKRDINCKVVRRRGKLYVINKKNPKFKARQGQLMEINSQKKTWSNFIKLTTYTSVAIVIILVLMAIFLLQYLSYLFVKSFSNIKRKDNIIFGILFFIFFLIVGLYPLISHKPIRIWFVIISLVFLIITIIKPNLFTFLNKLWIKFGILLGKIISPIVMGLVFFFVVTPIGIFIKILKKDVMGLKRGETSYWITREDKIQSMKKQF